MVFFFYILFGIFGPEFWGKMNYPNWTVAIVYPFSFDVHPETWENDSYVVTICVHIFRSGGEITMYFGSFVGSK